MMQQHGKAPRCNWRTRCEKRTFNASGYCTQHESMAKVLNVAAKPTAASRRASSRVATPKLASRKDAASVVAAQDTGKIAPTGDHFGVSAEPSHPTRFSLRDYQVEASTEAMAELAENDRCQVRMACGMGKTVVAQNIARMVHEAWSDSGITVFITSGIELTKQSAGDFAADGFVPDFESISLHSESDEFRSSRNQTDAAKARALEEQKIDDFLTMDTDKPRIVFTTYDSAHKLAAAQQRLGMSADADLTILDETHHIAGTYEFRRKRRRRDGAADSPADELTIEGKIPRVFLNDVPGSLRSRRRLYLGATPKVAPESVQYGGEANFSRNDLRIAYSNEDSGRSASTTLLHTDRAVFGRTVYSAGLKRAQELNALVNVRGFATTADERYRPPTQSEESYIALAGTLNKLATGDGHNVLVFAPTVKAADQARDHWKEVARAMSGGMPVAEARDVLESGSGDARRARYAMLAEYGRVMSVSAESHISERQRATSGHFDRDYAGDRGCVCGSPGGWCACVNVVNNVDLFGEGISVNSIDTVVCASDRKVSDTALTQAVGRAMRRFSGKSHGSVVVPSGASARSRVTANNVFYGLSRLWRDSSGHGLRGERMSPIGAGAEHFPVESDGGGTTSVDSLVRSIYEHPDVCLATVTAFNSANSAAMSYFRDTAEGGLDSWKSLSADDRHDYVVGYARAFARDAELGTPALRFLSLRQPGRDDLALAQNEMKLVRRLCSEGDFDSLTPDERRMAESAGFVSNSAPTKTKRSYTTAYTGTGGSESVQRVIYGRADRALSQQAAA